jgi:DNA-directed RNA polymerase subunit beta'
MAEPVDLVFFNKMMDRIAIKQMMYGLVTHFGITYTTHVLDQLKALGFQQATLGGVSLGIGDLLTAPSKSWLIKDAEHHGNLSRKHHNYGDLHAVEKLRQLIETWYATSEYLKQGMNPNFRVTDPSNPVHMMSFSGARGSASQIHQLVGMRGLMSDPQGQIIDLPIQSNFRGGLSLTEYIISCYGARKGVVDTAVRTSDAGYLTRRLVEVVQRIVVRRLDCGTPFGISISNYREKRNTFYQKLVGRVLAENVYIKNRCLAIRNQDIGNCSADRFFNLAAKQIRVRSPLTCRSMLWICQLCYGWSLTNGDLVEIGEAVGIIAGQSIGEPGTQLTLRTFHTGGVFAGDIAEHVRTPSNGVVRFDENFVYPTRTRHGHPAWICHTSLFVSIRSKNKNQDLIIPPKSLLLIQNNQYVESNQVIAEIRAKASPPKEKICKYIYSDLNGEIFWVTGVRHTSEYIHSYIHPILRTCHVWVLSAKFSNKKKFPVSFYKNQDKIDSHVSVARDKSFLSSLTKKDRLNIQIFNSYISKKNQIFIKWKLTHAVFNNLKNSADCENIILYGYDIVKKRRNIFLREMHTNFYFSLEIQNNGILWNNDFFAVTDHPNYELNRSGMLRYGSIKIGSNGKNNDSRNGEGKIPHSGFKILKEGNFFIIPERVYISPQALSSVLIRNNEFIQVGVSITSIITSDTSGLVRIERKLNNTYEIKILPGVAYYPDSTYKPLERISILIPPGKKFFNKFPCDHWTYFQWIIPFKGKPFALLRPAIGYTISNRSKKTNLLNLLKNTNLEIHTANYLLHADGEQIQIVHTKYIKLVRTCLIMCWDKKKFPGKAHVSFLKVKTKNSSRNYLRIGLMNRFASGEKEHDNKSYSRYVSRKNYYDDIFPLCRNRLKSKHEGIIRISSINRNEYQPLVVLSPSDLIRIFEKNGSKFTKKYFDDSSSTQFFNFQNPPESFDLIGDGSLPNNEKFLVLSSNPLGCLQNETNSFEYFHWIIAEITLLNAVDQTSNSFRKTKWFFSDEFNEIHRYLFDKSINNNLSNRYLLFPMEEKSPTKTLGQLFFENLQIPEDGKIFLSGQVIGIHTDYFIIRLGKPHLANEGAIIHNNCGGFVEEGDTLTTLTYERLKSGDIIQGLPKVEQLLEARSMNSVSIDLENSFRDWSNDMKKFIGNLWGFFLGAKISREQGQMILVDQIQEVYKSQGVYISNKHIEIIVRQMTSGVLTSEDGVVDIFLPGELIELSRARKMNRVLEEVVSYEPVLLGISKASLNTRSFISEASFQETTRVLARAALKGRIDWLKGLKENVIVGGIIPAGTGSKEIIWQRIIEQKEEFFWHDRKNYSKKEKGKLSSYHNAFPVSASLAFFCDALEKSI